MKLYEILTSEDVVSSIKQNLDYILELIPEIKYMIGFEHKHPHHHLDVWEHTLYALSLSENNFEIRLCLLLHDIGKPFSYKEGEDGVRHFNGHPKVSAQMSKEILTRLNLDEKLIEEMCYLIEFHDMPISEKAIKTDYKLSIKRYKIQECDVLAHNPDKLEKRKEYLVKIKKKLEIFKMSTNLDYTLNSQSCIKKL